MDLSPKLLTDIEFREQWRGYNPSEVDEFLERVAAGVEELQARLADALERASNAERRLLERSDEDEIRRTLVLAQRTAVAAMDEARAEADRLVGETETRCRQLVADAEAQAAELDAEITTRRRTELGSLADERAVLERDIEELRDFADAARQRLAELLRAQLEALDTGFVVAPTPPVAEVSIPEPARAAPRPPEPEPEPWRGPEVAAEPAPEAEPVSFAPEPEPEPEAAPVAVPEPMSVVDELRQAREELADALRRAGVEPEQAVDEASPMPPQPAVFDDSAGEPTGTYDMFGEHVTASPATEAPVAEADEPRWRDDQDDDPFLAELRRAVVDTEPLGPRDDEGSTFAAATADDDDDAASGGLFRRGRRRP